jgi:hypothetical protein
MEAPALAVVVVRLADEGVPLCAIARATQIPSTNLRQKLHEAVQAGWLVELPRDDWPPGCPRDQRALQISRMLRDNREALNIVVQQLFALTPSESRLLVKLLDSEHTSREALHIALSRTSDPTSDIKIVDVLICDMRKRLQKFGIEILTLRSYGFQISLPDRNRILELILPQA